LLTLLDQYGQKRASQSAERCLDERRSIFQSQSTAGFKNFVSQPRNLQELNQMLPGKLRRVFGPLNAVDFQLYLDYDAIGKTLQKSIDDHGLQDLNTYTNQVDDTEPVEELDEFM
jgi:hypothetical protein